MMKRDGLVVDSQTLYDQIQALARALWPAYDRIGAALLEERLLFVDETPWPSSTRRKTRRASTRG